MFAECVLDHTFGQITGFYSAFDVNKSYLAKNFTDTLLLYVISMAPFNEVIWLVYCMSIRVYGGRRGLDRMVVGLTTTYAISAYHH